MGLVWLAPVERVTVYINNNYTLTFHDLAMNIIIWCSGIARSHDELHMCMHLVLSISDCELDYSTL